MFALLAATVSAQTLEPSTADVETRVQALISRMTLNEKLSLIGGVDDFYTRPIPRLGIPSLRMSDGPLGVRCCGPTTSYPAGIALAATWDVDLAGRVGISMGHDARARGVHILLAPGMNIYRSPLNGRNFEYFGEDPFLVSRMAVEVIEGIQSQGVIATAKHFMGNNSEYGREDHSSDIDERTMREIYLPAFEAAVKEARVGAIMDSYNLVNGVYMTENALLNNEIAKREWGFDGILMSDWGATHDGIAAANGGLDLEMPDAEYMNTPALRQAIQSGKVKESTIDDKVRRILRKAIEFGFFDREQSDGSPALYSQEGRTAALEEARSSIVLLKNKNHLLPLDRKRVKTIAVLGPHAYPTPVGGRGSSTTTPYHAVSYLEGISDAAGTDVRVLHLPEEVPIDVVASRTQLLNAPKGAPGLRGEYFNNENLQGTPSLIRTDEHVDFRWGEGSYAEHGPANHFSVRWTGYFLPMEEDDYRFHISTAGGTRLYIDDDLVIDDWRRRDEALSTYTKHLDPHKLYKIRLEYSKRTDTASARFGIAPATHPLDEKTKALAVSADVVVLCVGFDARSEGEGSDRSFTLPDGQDGLIQQISALNKNVIVVLNAGGNVDMTGWIEQVPAVLHAWYPGQEGGTALAQILFGQYSPSGKLPVTFERRLEDNPTFHSYYPQKGDKHVAYSEGIFVGYRGYEKSGIKPMFPFGFGLSYTNFAYSDLKITPAARGGGAVAEVFFQVKNVGPLEGAEVAQVYVSDPRSSVPRPVKELKGFSRVNLRPAEKKVVQVILDRRAFSFYDMDLHDWKTEPGEFSIQVGSSSAEIKLQGKYALVPEHGAQEKRAAAQ